MVITVFKNILIFKCSSGLRWLKNLYFLFREEKQHIKLPRNIEDAKSLGKVLSHYTDSYYNQVLGGYFITYILYPYLSEFHHNHCILFSLVYLQGRGDVNNIFKQYTCIYCLFITKRLLLLIIINKCQWEKSPWQCNSLQSFAIPGSIFLSILSGFLFPFHLALFLVCLVSKNVSI